MITRRPPRATPVTAPLALTTVLLALLGMFGPFSIDAAFPAFREMGEDFAASEASMQLVVSAYLGAFAVMSLFHGPLSDAVGRKPVMVTGAAVYAPASIGCALSPSLPVLLAFRVLQGMSAGAGTIVSRTVVRDLFEGARAQRLMATIAMIFGISPALAPIIGGWLLLSGPRPPVFWFLCGFGAFIAIAVLVLLPESHPPERRTPVDVRSILGGVMAVARMRRFQVLSAASAFSFAGQFLYIGAAPIFVVSLLGKGARDFWVFFVPMVSGMIPGSFTNSRLAGTVSGDRLIVSGQAVALTGAIVGLGLALLPATAELPPGRRGSHRHRLRDGDLPSRLPARPARCRPARAGHGCLGVDLRHAAAQCDPHGRRRAHRRDLTGRAGRDEPRAAGPRHRLVPPVPPVRATRAHGPLSNHSSRR
ncbi:multidrug effflux MFS transporter [Janibacter limosus]|uniref:Multidrug effflux MFS transporter n=1 Tax=Janibacter limosus TaxID=53458 RepID=A0AC61U7J9_9MICO|nr:multidrug effflux MFS transporter [Janibacter limosus]UUZ46025.1 multidrug effflux MFS transporter [Janibacter limosus]